MIFRVEEAGFTKRFGSKLIGKVQNPPSPDATRRLPFHVINLSESEKYGFTIDAGTPRVMDLATGALKTVTVDSASATYINQSNFLFFAFVTILDYTLIVNKEVVPAMLADTTAAGANAVIFQVANGREGVYTIEVDGSSASYTATSTGSTQSTVNIASNLATTLDGLLGVAYTVTAVGGNYIIVEKTSAITSATCSDPVGGAGIKKTLANDFLSSSDLLPPFGVNNMIVKIGAGAASDGQSTPVFYMKFRESSGHNGYWDETIAPGIVYKIDPTTMPQVMIRNGDGTFTIQPAEWSNRVTGDTDSVPNPPFIGSTINDAVYFKDRLGLATGEEWYFSRSGDYFNYWPSKSTAALDTDPFGRRASSNRVSIQRFGLPYRKVLWATSDETQFEMSTADLFTEKKAVFDPTTTYLASAYCRPEPMADLLYFPSWNGPNALILEYTYDALSLTAKAPEITKHVRGYLPHPILGLTADPPTGNLIMWSAASPSVVDKLWVWTEFTNGNERQQSCWSKWEFPAIGGALIHAAKVVGGVLYILMGRKEGVFIESVALTDTPLTDFPNYTPRLDRSLILSLDDLDGTYDPVANTTTYTAIPYDTTGGVVVKTDGTTVSFEQDGSDIVLPGTVPKIMFGIPYDSNVVLSKQYYRDEKGVAVLNGKLSLTEFTVAHKDTGQYGVEIAQPGRDTETHKFTARVIGSTQPPNYVGAQPIVYGTFSKGGFSVPGDTSTITIRSNTHLPCTISAIVFKGIFNEPVRAG